MSRLFSSVTLRVDGVVDVGDLITTVKLCASSQDVSAWSTGAGRPGSAPDIYRWRYARARPPLERVGHDRLDDVVVRHPSPFVDEGDIADVAGSHHPDVRFVVDECERAKPFELPPFATQLVDGGS